MAYSFSRRFRRTRYRPRSKYNRRYRRYKKYRRYKRWRRGSKIEYKWTEHNRAVTFESKFEQVEVSGGAVDVLEFPLCHVIAIGSNTTNIFQRAISQGTGQGQRIGAKIRPVKLRVWGTISMLCDSETFSLVPYSCSLRCIVYQVRNGNPEYGYNTQQFTSVNPVFDIGSGQVHPDSGKRLFSVYYGDYYTTQNPATVHTYVKADNLNIYNGLPRTPFRNGIGTSLRILYDKVYTLQTGYKTEFPFRFKTKRPNRMVWPEDPSGIANALQGTARNPIYITWWFVPSAPASVYHNHFPVSVSNHFQLFYTDA